MNKSTALLISGLVAGILLGVGAAFLFILSPRLPDAAKELSKEAEDIDFEPCRSLFAVSDVCVDQTIADYAVHQNRGDLCAMVQDGGIMAACQVRVGRIAQLQRLVETGAAPSICSEEGDDAACVDLMLTLAAANQKDPTICQFVDFPTQRNACLVLSQGIGEPVPVPAERAYGVFCPQSTAACERINQTIASAVGARDGALCAGLGLYEQECLLEVTAYRAFRLSDQAICASDELHTGGFVDPVLEEACLNAYWTAQALGAGEAEFCDRIGPPDLNERCLEDVGAGGVQRFGYLGE